MATVKRKVTETVEVSQEPHNGSFLTLFDLAEFGSDCADVKIPGDCGIQAKVGEDGFSVVRLRAVADIVTHDDDKTDPGNGDTPAVRRT